MVGFLFVPLLILLLLLLLSQACSSTSFISRQSHQNNNIVICVCARAWLSCCKFITSVRALIRLELELVCVKFISFDFLLLLSSRASSSSFQKVRFYVIISTFDSASVSPSGFSACHSFYHKILHCSSWPFLSRL